MDIHNYNVIHRDIKPQNLLLNVKNEDAEAIPVVKVLQANGYIFVYVYERTGEKISVSFAFFLSALTDRRFWAVTTIRNKTQKLHP